MTQGKMTALLLLVGGIFVAQSAQGNTVEFIESPYAQQAPQEIVEIAEKAAALVGYEKPYEIAIPKKAGLQVSPLQAIVTSTESNPQTSFPMISVNPPWFSALPVEQQVFLLARCFTKFETPSSLPMKALPCVQVLVSLLVMLLSFLMLRMLLPSFKRKVLVCFLLAGGVSVVLELLVVDKIFARAGSYLTAQHGSAVVEKTIAKTNDRDAAVQALLAMDAVVKEGANKGEQAFVPYVGRFEHLANAARGTRE